MFFPFVLKKSLAYVALGKLNYAAGNPVNFTYERRLLYLLRKLEIEHFLDYTIEGNLIIFKINMIILLISGYVRLVSLFSRILCIYVCALISFRCSNTVWITYDSCLDKEEIERSDNDNGV